METDFLSRPKFRKDDLVPLCDSCTMICALDRRTELQTVNRLSRVDFQGQVMRIGDGLDSPTPLVTGAPEASKDFKAHSPDSRRQLMEDCFFGRRFAGGWRPSPPDGPTPLALHAQPCTPSPAACPFIAAHIAFRAGIPRPGLPPDLSSHCNTLLTLTVGGPEPGSDFRARRFISRL